MARILVLIELILLLTSCESSPAKNSSPKEISSKPKQKISNLDGQSSKGKFKRPSAKIRKILNKTYSVEFNFDQLLDIFISATNAAPNDYSIYSYDLNFDFFSNAPQQASKQLDLLAKTGDKYYNVTSARNSRVKKHFYVGTRTEKGFCGACFFGLDQISYALGIAYYEKPGPSSGFFAGSIKFLRGQGNETYILVGDGTGFKSPYKVTGFTVGKKSIELLYLDRNKTRYRTVIQLNSTLDVTSYMKQPIDEDFRVTARLIGGVVDKYAVK